MNTMSKEQEEWLDEFAQSLFPLMVFLEKNGLSMYEVHSRPSDIHETVKDYIGLFNSREGSMMGVNFYVG